MDLRFITAQDSEYAGEVELRYRVLREPLGMTREQVFFPFEKESWHLVALDDGAVVGCVLFLPKGEKRGRLFQMAVAQALQGRGIGRLLVRRLEQRARKKGFDEIFLHARDRAVGFYERLGYRITGEPFEEIGIMHRMMTKMHLVHSGNQT